MVNPCYDCPRYREYGKYLDEVLITKQPDHPVGVDGNQLRPVRLIPNIDGPPITEIDNNGNHRPEQSNDILSTPLAGKGKRIRPVNHKRESRICAMSGCDLTTESEGALYCKSCRTTRAYYKKLGQAIPTELTPQQRQYRATKARKEKEAAAKAAKAARAKSRKKAVAK